ncbi:single-stranded DNA-binding protein [Pseudoflavonifractor sp. P01025]|uniref:single-stranded DNA-binding protein n=1 Tax=Flintibacter porci TaxID=3342383 RepID=UPI0035B673FF
MLNKIILMGRLGRDPEVRYTQSGTPVASFSLAVDRDFVDQATGRRPTDWIEVAAWNAKAKFVQQYFRKGQLAVVEGRLQIRDWTDKEGAKRRTAEVVADQIYFAGAKTAPPSEGNADERSLPAPPAQEFMEQDDEGELPF